RSLLALLAAALPLAGAGAARAHAIDAASLTLVETAPGRFAVRFQSGSVALARQIAAAPADFPAPCHLDGSDLACGPSGLVGTIRFPWLEGTLTRLMVSIEWRGGARLSRIATAGARSLTVYGGGRGLGSVRPVVLDYVRLGVEHIATGFDHLLFVAALTLLVRRRRP